MGIEPLLDPCIVSREVFFYILASLVIFNELLDAVDWTWQSVDTATDKARCGGDQVGKNPEQSRETGHKTQRPHRRSGLPPGGFWRELIAMIVCCCVKPSQPLSSRDRPRRRGIRNIYAWIKRMKVRPMRRQQRRKGIPSIYAIKGRRRCHRKSGPSLEIIGYC